MAKTTDNLTRDSCAALAAGMSYGKYMAAKSAGAIPTSQVTPRADLPEPVGQQKRPFCIRCGKPISDRTRQRLYCGEMCRKLATAERSREKYLKRTASQGPSVVICSVCGKEFPMTDRRKTTCSPSCSLVARSERVRRYQKRKNAEENVPNGI